MATQGRALNEGEIHRIVSLLSETDLSTVDIAARMGCSRSVVASINRKQKIRLYNGCRATWQRGAGDGRLTPDAESTFVVDNKLTPHGFS
jgi:hypothetical protein